MITVELFIATLWWECPQCLHQNIVEIDEGEDPQRLIQVHCGICKNEYTAEWDGHIPEEPEGPGRIGLSCGHPLSTIVSSDEGTHYCGECEFDKFPE